MSKQHHKTQPLKPAPITKTQLAEAARSLVRRGLASSAILDDDPVRDGQARRVARRLNRANATRPLSVP